MLVRALRAEALPPGARVLDVCTGSGLLAVTAALCGARATAVDVSRRAVACAALNARLNGVHVRALRGDLLTPVRGERFDAIVSNPPYLPSEGGPAAGGAARAWDAGRDGRAVLDRLCAQAPDHLTTGGVLLVVQSSLCGTEATLDALRAAGLTAQVAHRHHGALGPLLRARAPMLEARGLLAPGQREEEVVVVRAVAEPRPAAASRAPVGPAVAIARPITSASLPSNFVSSAIGLLLDREWCPRTSRPRRPASLRCYCAYS
jgi:release factor glutamine methyltransferase